MKTILRVTLVILVILTAHILIGQAFAETATKTVTKTFAWDEPTDLAIIDRWELYWSETAGGPYTIVMEIPKVEGQTVFESPAVIDITGPAGSRQTRYFVLIACGTVQEAGQPVARCSEDSNEVSFYVDIPPSEMRMPVNFRILPE